MLPRQLLAPAWRRLAARCRHHWHLQKQQQRRQPQRAWQAACTAAPWRPALLLAAQTRCRARRMPACPGQQSKRQQGLRRAQAQRWTQMQLQQRMQCRLQQRLCSSIRSRRRRSTSALLLRRMLSQLLLTMLRSQQRHRRCQQQTQQQQMRQQMPRQQMPRPQLQRQELRQQMPHHQQTWLLAMMLTLLSWARLRCLACLAWRAAAADQA